MRRALAALAVAAVAAPAAAYVRTSDPDTGVEVFWPLPAVAYDLSSAPSFPSPGCAAGPAGDPVEDAVRASFAPWDEVTDALQLVYGGRIPEIRVGLAGTAENVVVVRKGWCSSDPVASADPCMADPDVDCGGIYDCYEDHGPADRSTVALTTVLYDPSTGRMFDADLEVNGWDGRGAGTPISTPTSSAPHGYYFTCNKRGPGPGNLPACTTYGQAGCYGYDLQNTVTHEAGHFVGLAHPCDDAGTPSCDAPLPPWESVPYAERTMYPSTTLGETTKRSLSEDDVAGVRAAYPGPSGCGQAGGTPGVLAAILAALAALARRPRLRR